MKNPSRKHPIRDSIDLLVCLAPEERWNVEQVFLFVAGAFRRIERAESWLGDRGRCRCRRRGRHWGRHRRRGRRGVDDWRHASDRRLLAMQKTPRLRHTLEEARPAACRFRRRPDGFDLGGAKFG